MSAATQALGARSGPWLDRARGWRPTAGHLAGLLGALFIVTTAWWLSQDSRVPDFDSGDHLQHSFFFYETLLHGHPSDVLKTSTFYPPLAEVLGALGTMVGGLSVGSVVMTTNLVFVPLLVLGCYRTGKLVAGPRAGLLAVVFALGTPILVSEFHEFLLDPPLTAMVAVTVWLLLASDRFADRRYVAWAGGAAGIGMLTKQTFALYLVGLVAVMLLRGGWRNWRGCLVFAGITLAIAWGWYVYHFDTLNELSKGFVAGTAETLAATGLLKPTPGPDSRVPEVWSSANFLWYLWATVNHVLLLPFTALFAGGTVAAVVDFVRRPHRESLVPELVGGVLVSWGLMTFFISVHDPRYVMPMLVFASVLATAWLVRVPRRWMVAGGAAVTVVAAVNFAAVTFGLGSPARIALPGAPKSGLGVDRFTVYSPEGFLVSGPERAGDLPAIFRKVKRQGAQVAFESGGSNFFNSQGIWALVEAAELPPAIIGADPRTFGPRILFAFTRPPTGRYSHPCLHAADGTPVFFAYGGQQPKPFEQWTLTCPRP